MTFSLNFDSNYLLIKLFTLFSDTYIHKKNDLKWGMKSICILRLYEITRATFLRLHYKMKI